MKSTLTRNPHNCRYCFYPRQASRVNFCRYFVLKNFHRKLFDFLKPGIFHQNKSYRVFYHPSRFSRSLWQPPLFDVPIVPRLDIFSPYGGSVRTKSIHLSGNCFITSKQSPYVILFKNFSIITGIISFDFVHFSAAQHSF